MADSLWSWWRDPGFFPITPLKSPMLPMSMRLSCTIPAPVFMESSGESLCEGKDKKIGLKRHESIHLSKRMKVLKTVKKNAGESHLCTRVLKFNVKEQQQSNNKQYLQRSSCCWTGWWRVSSRVHPVCWLVCSSATQTKKLLTPGMWSISREGIFNHLQNCFCW